MPDDDHDKLDDEQPDDDDDQELDEELEQIRADPAGARRTIAEARAQAAEYRRRMREVEVELERLKTEGLSEQERAVAEAEQRGRDTALAEHGRKLLEAQLRAAAAGKLQDPDDAVRYLELDALLELDDDHRDLDKRIAQLVEDKPYLAASSDDDKGRVGVRSQGARTAPGGTKDVDDGSAWLRSAARR